MTQKGRDKLKGVYEPKPATPTVGVGHGRHQLDGRWGGAKTIFDSELYRVLVEIIDDALSYANSTPLPAEGETIGRLFESAGLTVAQAQVMDLRVGGRSLGEIADALDVTRSTVQTHVARATLKLRGVLHDRQ